MIEAKFTGNTVLVPFKGVRKLTIRGVEEEYILTYPSLQVCVFVCVWCAPHLHLHKYTRSFLPQDRTERVSHIDSKGRVTILKPARHSRMSTQQYRGVMLGPKGAEWIGLSLMSLL